MRNLASAFIQLFSKENKLDKTLEVHFNGEDNLYPDYIETLIANSVTASESAELMASFLSGKGFEGSNEVIVHAENGTTLLEFLNDICESISKHKGVFIHVNYNTEFEAKDYEVLDYTTCRVGKKDDNGYNGKIHICQDWSSNKLAKAADKVDVFNPKKSVIKSQVDKAKGLSKYKGQVLFYNPSKLIYPYSRVHAVNEDCESEKRASTYKGVSLRKGFFGKTLVVTKPLVQKDYNKSNTEEVAKYNEEVSERTAFRKTLQQFIGAENVDGVLHLEMEFEEDINDEVLFKNIDSNINDKLFAFTENSVRDNIRIAFKNIPAPLIASQDGKLFGSSGKAILAMRIFYQEQTEKERMKIEQLINKLMKNFKDPLENLTITPLINVSNKGEDTNV